MSLLMENHIKNNGWGGYRTGSNPVLTTNI